MATVTDEELYSLIVDTGQSVQKLNQVADAAEKADRKMESAGKSAKNVGNGMTQLGYAVDDLQSGFRGVSNNIQPLLQSLGTSGGLASTISIAVIAAYQLYTHWDDLMALMGAGKVKSQADEMEELAKKTSRTADETARLLKYQQIQATINTMQTSQTSAQSAQENLVKAAVAEGGVKNVVRGLAQLKQANDPRMKQIDDEERKYEQYVRGAGKNVSDETRARYQKRRDALAGQQDKEVRDELARAAHDPGRLQGLLNKVTANKGAFGPNADKLAAGLVSALPENIAANAENDKITRKAEESKKEAEAARKEKDSLDDYEWDQHLESNRRWKQNKADKKKKVDAEVSEAKRIDPNLGDMLSTLMLNSAKSSGPEGGNAMAKKLVQQLTGKYGADVATKLVGEASVDAKQKYIGDMLKPPEERKSAVFGGADFAKAVQSGVSNKDTPERQLKELMAINFQLKRILERPNAGVALGD